MEFFHFHSDENYIRISLVMSYLCHIPEQLNKMLNCSLLISLKLKFKVENGHELHTLWPENLMANLI